MMIANLTIPVQPADIPAARDIARLRGFGLELKINKRFFGGLRQSVTFTGPVQKIAQLAKDLGI